MIRLLGTLQLTLLSGVWGYSLPSEPLNFDKIKPPSARSVYDHAGRVIDYWYGENLRLYKPRSKIDSKLVELVVAAEDAKFYSHSGFDLEEIKNSLRKNLENGKIKRGGSTITQQLAKNLFLDKEKSLVRKLFEIPWAIRLEKDLKKNQILELYLNTIEWGPGVYGAEAACRHYFDRSCEHLEIPQAVYMAIIIPNPPLFDLFGHPKLRSSVDSRRKFLVKRLIDEKKIPIEEHDDYLNGDYGFVSPDSSDRKYPVSHKASYFGNRFKKEEWIKDLAALSSQSSGDLTLSLDREEMRKIPSFSFVTSPEKKIRYLVKKREGKIVAFKKVPAGKAAVLDEFETEWSLENSFKLSELIERPSSKNLR
jgi:monofunctional biosynthetic peptidoglycan transglycosylase